VSWGWAKKGR